MFDTYNVVSWDKFDPQPLDVFRIISKDKSERTLCKDFISLDTETSHNHDEENPVGWMYQWCFKYQNDLVYGRKPSELVDALKKVKEVNNLDADHRISIYVHNLGYDYVYFKEWVKELYKDDLSAQTNMLAVAKHKIISVDMDGLLFKCSYRLTQKSLDAWSKEVGTKHKKLVGTIDYDLIRYQDSKLDRKDWKYMFYDVIVLDEALRLQMEIHEDTLLSIPLTNTGYVRRDARTEYKKNTKNREQFVKTGLNYDTYMMCRKEFAGGITHGNRFVASKTVEGDIRHRDFASHYPSQQRCYTAPIGKFVLDYDRSVDGDIGYTIEDLASKVADTCFLCEIKITDLTIKKGITLPYAQTCKFYEGKVGTIDVIEDNGRILKMEGSSVVVVNEIDLKWLCKQYTFEYEIIKVYIAKRGAFPKYLLDTVDKFFYGKTAYKEKEKDMEKNGIEDDDPRYIANHRDLMISKGMLNGIYGMSATDPVRISYFEDDNGEWTSTKLSKDDVEDALFYYYQNYNSFMSYQLGVWTTSGARNELLDFVELIGYDNFLYADTDSIFYLSTPEIEKRIEDKNAEFRKINDEKGFFIETEKQKVYYNQFELEKETIVKFRFLHAKCYGYILDDGSLKVTIAGVSKYGRNGNTRVKELGSLDNLKSGYNFIDCGGTRTIYTHLKPSSVYVENHLLEVSSSAIICNTTKTLHGLINKDEEDIEWSVADI